MNGLCQTGDLFSGTRCAIVLSAGASGYTHILGMLLGKWSAENSKRT